MGRPRSDDRIFRDAKEKISKILEKEEDVDKVVALVTCLTKMMAVELKMSEDDYGAALGGDPK